MPAWLIFKLLNVATPVFAATAAVEPVAKLPEERVSEMVSLFPVPEVTTLPNWSSTLTPMPKVVPAVVDDEGGWVVTSSWLGLVATMPKLLVVAVVTVVWVVSDAVIV